MWLRGVERRPFFFFPFQFTGCFLSPNPNILGNDVFIARIKRTLISVKTQSHVFIHSKRIKRQGKHAEKLFSLLP